MITKIIYIFLSCCFLTQVNAQQQNVVKHLLDSVTKHIHSIAKDKNLSAPCLGNVKLFDKAFVTQDTGSWSKSTVTAIRLRAEKLVTTLQPKGKLICDSKELKDLVTQVSQLKGALNKLFVQLDGNRKLTAVKTDTTRKVIPAVSKRDDSTIVEAGLSKPTIDSIKDKDSSRQGITGDLSTVPVSKAGNERNPLLIPIGMLLVLVIGGWLLYFRRVSHYKKIIKAMSDNTDSNTGQPQVEALNIQPELSEALVQPGGEVDTKIITADGDVTAALPAERNELIPAQPDGTACFLCEVMMTAGPRKKYMSEENADKDLGEDVCGFLSNSNKVLVWLLDGTSDLHCLKNPVTKREYFSSRLLALSIAEKLKTFFLESPAASIGEMVALAISNVKSAWLDTIEQLPAEEKIILKNNIANKNYPECATTLLIAQLSIRGDLTVYRSGDSKMLLFTAPSQNELSFVDTPLSEKNDQSNDRIFFRLRLNEQEKFDIVYNEPLHEIINFKDINTVISFSDGIGMSTEQLLIEEYKAAPDKTRNEIIYYSQETGDDKSICFIEIRKQATP